MTDTEKFAKLILEECRKTDTEKFAKLILEECRKTVPPYVKPEQTSLAGQLAIMVTGVLVLLGLSVAAFDGAMVPAVWQLTSVIWLGYRIWKSLA